MLLCVITVSQHGLRKAKFMTTQTQRPWETLWEPMGTKRETNSSKTHKKRTRHDTSTIPCMYMYMYMYMYVYVYMYVYMYMHMHMHMLKDWKR